MSNQPTTRSYTTYNLFFQLEQEYILQTLLGFQPTVAPKDIFDPTDKTYPAKGPSLPSRYEHLILPYDWHIPGKTRRRKRSHRKKCHGKIGTRELNEQISTAWSIADDEIRNFCACLSDIESKKYKKDKRKTPYKEKVTRKRNKGKTKVVKLTKTEPKDDGCNDLSPSFDSRTVNSPNFSQEEFAIDSPFLDADNVSSSKFCLIVSRESVRVEHEDLSRASSHIEPFAQVDMQDNEIIEIWKTTPIQDDIPSVLFTSQMCVAVVNPTLALAAASWQSFIDAEYEKFR